MEKWMVYWRVKVNRIKDTVYTDHFNIVDSEDEAQYFFNQKSDEFDTHECGYALIKGYS